MNAYDWYVETEGKLQTELDDLPTGSEEYKAVLDNLKDIHELRSKEERLYDEAVNGPSRRDDEKRRHRFELLKIGIGCGTTLICTFASIFAEETRVLNSKAWSFIQKPKMF